MSPSWAKQSTYPWYYSMARQPHLNNNQDKFQVSDNIKLKLLVKNIMIIF